MYGVCAGIRMLSGCGHAWAKVSSSKNLRIERPDATLMKGGLDRFGDHVSLAHAHVLLDYYVPCDTVAIYSALLTALVPCCLCYDKTIMITFLPLSHNKRETKKH